MYGLIDAQPGQWCPCVSGYDTGVNVLRNHVAAEREHRRSQEAGENAEPPVPQPGVGEEKGQPTMQEDPGFQCLEQQVLAGHIGGKQDPRGRIEQRQLHVADIRHAAIDRRIPQR